MAVLVSYQPMPEGGIDEAAGPRCNMVRLERLLMVIVVSSLGITVMTVPGLRGGQRGGVGVRQPRPEGRTGAHEADSDDGDAVYYNSANDAEAHLQSTDATRFGFEPLHSCPETPRKPKPLQQLPNTDLARCLQECRNKKHCTYAAWGPSSCVLLHDCSLPEGATGFKKLSTPAPTAEGPTAIGNIRELSKAGWVTIQNVKYRNYIALPYDSEPVGRAIRVVPHEIHGTKGWAFQTVLGTFVSAETNGFLSGDRRQPRSMEHFTVEFIGASEEGERAIIRCTKSRKLVVGTKNKKMQSRVATQDDAATHFVIQAVPPPDPSEVTVTPNRDLGMCAHLADPILLFTSPKPVKGEYSKRHATVLANWKRLPCTEPLVITDDEDTLAATKQHHIATDNSVEIQHTYAQPTYRGLFDTAFKHSAYKYAMYSNSDIMYSTNLAETFLAVLKFKEANDEYRDAPLLIIGQRTNIGVGDDWEAGDRWYEAVEALEREGKMFQPDAEDYFLVSRDLVKWRDMPDFVVGGAAFDNWFVAKVVKSAKRVLTVDATRTITAVHMDHETHRACGSKCSHNAPKSAYNTKLATSNGGTARGTTGDCEYATVRTLRGIEVLKRNQFYL
eukprot:TRINITY_DN15660_c0_g1_i1.p1 TRINITY_DN15660_c0_g1~~TRINITY_DN15660_c0_g1_i1.p1  ORF type:complete len:614 (+),score=159.27 TRINITY_DN15660_c0_g1_i1:1731-3572(+)